jgi:NRAMP (natural resistance-associated macrophage protein)-like metal ion transporter
VNPRRFGPGLLVTAAFIGPGTITTASSAGAGFGYALVWALLFSVIATVVLQEMAARLGLATRAGLAEALRDGFRSRWLGRAAVMLVIAAVGVGNAAYEAGNIAGAALAATTVTGVGGPIWALLTGGAAALLLGSGRYRVLERALVVLVLAMSGLFLWTALLVEIDWRQLAAGLLAPALPPGSTLIAVALVGTTVVPYNLFLHANAVREKWSSEVALPEALREARADSLLSIGLGGLITLAILSTAAAAFFQTGVTFGGDAMAVQLEPLLGVHARYVFAAGLLASGLTSAITAPLAAAYAVCGAMDWPQALDGFRFRLVWLLVLACGTLFAALGTKPLAAILFAQAANGFLLPVVAVFLLLVMNRRDLLGAQVNGPLANLAGTLVVAIAVGLGLAKLFSVFGYM